MPVIAVANLKGGVGKSTVAQNLAVCLSAKGRTTVLVDTDSVQESTIEWGGIREKKGLPPLAVRALPEDRLMSEILDLADQFEFVVIDGTPVLGEITTKAMSVADLVLIPVMPSGNDFRALRKFLLRCEDVRKVKLKQGFPFTIAVVMNEYSDKLIIDKAILEAVQKMEVRMLKTSLANRAAYREATLTGTGVVEMRDAKAAREIEALTDEALALLTANG